MLDEETQGAAACHAHQASSLDLVMGLRAVESGPQMGRSVEKQVRWFWRFVMMPLMFGLVGASVDFKTIDTSIIPKAVAIVVAGQPLSAACSSAPQAVMHMNLRHVSQACVTCLEARPRRQGSLPSPPRDWLELRALACIRQRAINSCCLRANL